MIINIFRAPLDKSRPIEDYIKFQNEVVIPEMTTPKGLLGLFHFHTDTEWGTVHIWESLAADMAEDYSPQYVRISQQLKALQLLPVDPGEYEVLEVHSGFTHADLLTMALK